MTEDERYELWQMMRQAFAGWQSPKSIADYIRSGLPLSEMDLRLLADALDPESEAAVKLVFKRRSPGAPTLSREHALRQIELIRAFQFYRNQRADGISEKAAASLAAEKYPSVSKSLLRSEAKRWRDMEARDAALRPVAERLARERGVHPSAVWDELVASYSS